MEQKNRREHLADRDQHSLLGDHGTKPRAKNTARQATAKFIEPPANFTAAITAEPKNEAPLENMS